MVIIPAPSDASSVSTDVFGVILILSVTLTLNIMTCYVDITHVRFQRVDSIRVEPVIIMPISARRESWASRIPMNSP